MIGLNYRERKHVEILQRRMHHLSKRVSNAPEKDLSFDKQELAALRWAVERVTSDRIPTNT